jgi:hypothetical protein
MESAMELFMKTLKFALNVYLISAVIALMVLGLVNILNRILQKKEN